MFYSLHRNNLQHWNKITPWPYSPWTCLFEKNKNHKYVGVECGKSKTIPVDCQYTIAKKITVQRRAQKTLLFIW